MQNGTLTKSDYWASQGKDAKRKELQRINEMVGCEVMWNDARKAAGLDPAPYPYAGNKSNTISIESNEESK